MLVDKLFDNFDRHITINGFRVIQIILGILVNEFIFRTRKTKLNTFIVLYPIKSRFTVMKAAGLYRNGISIITVQSRSSLLDFIRSIRIGVCPYRLLQPISNSPVKLTPFIKGSVYIAVVSCSVFGKNLGRHFLQMFSLKYLSTKPPCQTSDLL